MTDDQGDSIMTADGCLTGATILGWVDDPTNMHAWEAFATRYRAMLIAWCRRHGLKAAEADDVGQNITLHMKNKIRLYERATGRFRAWLKTVTYHECVDYLRSQRSGRTRELVDDPPARDDLEKVFDDQANAELLRTALAHAQECVAPRDFKIFTDLTFADRTAAEVAKELGMRIGSVQMVKSRVKKIVVRKGRALDETFNGTDDPR